MKATPKMKRPSEMSPARVRMARCLAERYGASLVRATGTGPGTSTSGSWPGRTVDACVAEVAEPLGGACLRREIVAEDREALVVEPGGEVDHVGTHDDVPTRTDWWPGVWPGVASSSTEPSPSRSWSPSTRRSSRSVPA